MCPYVDYNIILFQYHINLRNNSFFYSISYLNSYIKIHYPYPHHVNFFEVIII